MNSFDSQDFPDMADDKTVGEAGPGCLTKAAIAEVLYETYKIDRRNGKRFATRLFELIVEHLKAGHTVKLAGLGNFSVRDKTARPGRNLKTGSVVVIEERRVVNFRPSGTLNRRVSDRRAGRTAKTKA